MENGVAWYFEYSKFKVKVKTFVKKEAGLDQIAWKKLFHILGIKYIN